MKAQTAWLIVVMALLSGSAHGQVFKREELRIPAPGAGQKGLQALFVKPDLPGRLPLAIFTHGSPLKWENRQKLSPTLYLPIATEFARRGWAAAILMRRGYGDSGGEAVKSTRQACVNPDHVAAATAAASDVRMGIAHLGKRSDVDGSRVLAIGQSSGGLATVALTADPPPGLLAAINFAGGQIPTRNGQPCKGLENKLVDAFRVFGKTSRTPMLWIYSENDKLFPPQTAEQFKTAFTAEGARAEYVKFPAFGSDGHSLAIMGVLEWTPHVDSFLKRHDLILLDEPLPVPRPIATPERLSENGRKIFEKFLVTPPNRALAISPTQGVIGWQAGVNSLEQAKKSALERCAKYASDCRIVVINDEAVP